ncbi:hypothetical protein SLS55_003873 [Diplodia seriata]|uniref:Uncharacterized protein n=1 Tax=Diplodia seriata TaxID=420778 RepID=A0ABR3CHS1_9PEZI
MDEPFKRHVIAELEQLLEFRGDDQFETWQTQAARTNLALLHKAVPACAKEDENHDALELDHTTLFEDSTRYTKERVPIFTSKKIHTWLQDILLTQIQASDTTNELMDATEKPAQYLNAVAELLETPQCVTPAGGNHVIQMFNNNATRLHAFIRQKEQE